jgi:hypothetical protein
MGEVLYVMACVFVGSAALVFLQAVIEERRERKRRKLWRDIERRR